MQYRGLLFRWDPTMKSGVEMPMSLDISKNYQKLNEKLIFQVTFHVWEKWFIQSKFSYFQGVCPGLLWSPRWSHFQSLMKTFKGKLKILKTLKGVQDVLSLRYLASDHVMTFCPPNMINTKPIKNSATLFAVQNVTKQHENLRVGLNLDSIILMKNGNFEFKNQTT